MTNGARRIHQLPREVAEKIAAGEIVERPASVLKELLENSLDAGARQITVALRAGGKDLIRVQDDGGGIAADDLPLAVTRFATSKLAGADDLWRITTFGFRGEALPSIAAVSRFSLETREASDEAGTSVRVEGGRIVGVDDFPRQPGTTVEVRNLFFNAPARRKFQQVR